MRTRCAIDNGEDPAANKKVEKARTAAAITVNELCDEYEDKCVTDLAKVTVYYRKWDLKNIVRPYLGSLEVRKVTPSDIVHTIEASNLLWSVAKRVLTSMSQLFDQAACKQIIQFNPTAGIKLKAILGKRPRVKQRLMLSEAELRILLPNIDEKIGRENGLMFRILLAICVRTNELVKAHKQHINLKRGTWWVESENVKTRTGSLVPLVPTVVKWMEELIALSWDSEWLLPVRGGKRRNRLGDTHLGRSTLGAAITRAFEGSKLEMWRFTPHDTCSTANGNMRNMGVSKEISEIALNHKLQGMEGIHDVRDDIPERRAAMELWAAFVSDCCEGKNPHDGAQRTNVLALRRAG